MQLFHPTIQRAVRHVDIVEEFRGNDAAALMKLGCRIVHDDLPGWMTVA
jgi:hypothetical protein